MEIAPGTVISDRYSVLEVLGRGAMAVVYLVQHQQLGTLHALKVLQLPTWSIQRRLLQEGRIQGALNHENVVTVTDVVDVEGSPGLVMELVRGPSLDRLLQHGRLPPQVVLSLGIGILKGVAAAHREGLIHRDLKPGNILVDAAGTALVARVGDFGLAKLLRAEDTDGAVQTRSGASLGTPAYMAPEQIRDPRSVDVRSDVFALGALLYELATGVRAFPGEDLLDVFQRIDGGHFPPVLEQVPDLPADFAVAIEAALQPDPADRPQDVDALLELWTGGRGEAAGAVAWPPDLIHLARSLGQAGLPVGSLAPSAAHTFDIAASHHEPAPAVRPAEPRRRRPWLVLGAALGLLVVLAGLVVVVVGTSMTAGWLAWGYNAPPLPAPPNRPVLYSVAGVPALGTLATDRTRVVHQQAWDALLDGRSAESADLAREVLEQAPDAVGPRLILATALLQQSDSRAYGVIDAAVQHAGRGAGGDLARLAQQAIDDRPDRAAFEAYLGRWDQDLLARMLLPAIDGWEMEGRIDVASQAVALAPGRPGPGVLHARLLLEYGRSAEAEAALGTLVPWGPGARLVHADLLLHAGSFADARVQAEALLGEPTPDPGAWRVLAEAVRMQGQDRTALDGVLERAVAPDAPAGAAPAFARGAAQAAFALGRPAEAADWIDLGVQAARAQQDFLALVELTRLELLLARYLGRTEDLERARARAQAVAGMPELPRATRDRIGLREVLLQGLLSVQQDDAAAVQGTIERLEGLERGERLAAMLRAASLARRGEVSEVDEATRGGVTCPQRSFRASWMAEAGVARAEELFAAVVAQDTPCGLSGADRFARAQARAHLAALMLAADEPDLARRQLDDFELLMPDPDLGLPVYQLALQVREDLDLAGQGL